MTGASPSGSRHRLLKPTSAGSNPAALSNNPRIAFSFLLIAVLLGDGLALFFKSFGVFFFALILSSWGSSAAPAADLRLPLPPKVRPSDAKCERNGVFVVCGKNGEPQQIGRPIDKGRLE